MAFQRSQTANDASVSYAQAKATVDFLEPAPPVPGLPPFQVRFTFAPGGTFDSFLHFHAEHSEFLYCQKGQIRVTLGTDIRTVGPEDGLIEIPAWTPHRWEVLGDSTEDTVVWEQSTPDPEMKELFFRNIFNLFNDHNGNPPPLQVMKLFSDYDNYPVGAQPWVHKLAGPIRSIVNAAGKVASWSGYHSVYKDYTPARLMDKSASFGLN